MALDIVDLEKDVIQQCQTVFAGRYAIIKRQKPIGQLIRKNQAVFRPLVSKYGHNRVVSCCQDLLKRGAFLGRAKNGSPEPSEPSEGGEPEDGREESIDPPTDGSLHHVFFLYSMLSSSSNMADNKLKSP